MVSKNQRPPAKSDGLPDLLPKAESSALKLHKSLEELGFRNTFHLDKNGLACAETTQQYPASRVRILGIYRFEGKSDPDDLTIVYALEIDDGTRGTIVDAYGPQGSTELAKFLEAANDLRETSGLKDLPTDHEIIIKTH